MRRVLAIFVLLLCGLLVFVAGCENLGSDADGATTTTAADIAGLSVLYGTWDGTYTPDAAWDENGPLDDPPFTLGEPVTMQMELHPWSADTASYGTIGAGDLYPARVASLSLEGDQVTIVAITEASGLEDLVGFFTLTLEGDTLSGADDTDPQVPSGWVSSSGTVYLTLTAPWDAAASETTSSTAAPAGGGAGGDAADGGDADAGADEGADEPDFGIADDDTGAPDLVLGRADDGFHDVVHVGDIIVIHFEFFAEDEVVDVDCERTPGSILGARDISMNRDPATLYYYAYSETYEVLTPGNADLWVRATSEDGESVLNWQAFLIVE